MAFLIRSIVIGIVTAALLLITIPNLRNSVTATEEVASTKSHHSYNSAVRRAAPAVVNIYSRQYSNDDRLQLDTQGLGSGVIVSKNGYIITNYHVVADADQVIAALQDGRFFNAQLVGKDKRTDLALLRINDSNLPVIPLNSAYNAEIGDVVLAIGNPYNLGQTTTFGIISATGRNGLSSWGRQSFIQTDAAINQGNSGGALVNSNGELVGINTASFQQATDLETYGISFAIPYKLADTVMKKIIADGRVIRGYIGIDGRDINPVMARLMNTEQISGILVVGMAPYGPAEKAGFQVQDLLIAIDNKKVTGRQSVLDIVSALRPGTTVPMDIIRDGEKMTLSVTIEEDTQE